MPAGDSKIFLRPATESDEDFLMQLYESTRSAELQSVGWDAAQTRDFIRMQFNAQTRGYAVSYPQASNQIVTLNEQPAGRILVNRDKRAFVLVDIALLPQHRNRGIGTFLLQELLMVCAFITSAEYQQRFSTIVSRSNRDCGP